MRRRLWLFAVAMLGASLLSLMSGAYWFGPLTIWQALWSPSPTDVADLLIRTTRLPRTLVAMVVGASLAVAGCMIQTLTRNPLASPGLLGINAGALLVIVSLVSVWTVMSPWAWYAGALLGATLAAGIVWWVAMRGRSLSGPLHLVLAGAALTALCNAFSQALLVIDQQGLDTVLFWLAGSVAGRPLATIWPLISLALIAMLCVWPLARSMNVLAAGEAVAKGVGLRVYRLQAMMVILIVLLAGTSVAMAGNIAFVGLIVPHIAKGWLPVDHRAWIPGCALLGATLLLLADVVGRVVILPGEVPVGVMTALIGAPVFVALIRRQGVRHA
ncbi:FecCD family ABC transporter permease [Aidingimonas lacisalsi]|uniref:FecCD family ABC transporter permease n=1 Tax=Aidingimonas lacisalsi TaxID=2604086 RepID=UPI0011D23ABC|nr:iron ABC transporter permease [Aidingimonas lacisalsi]